MSLINYEAASSPYLFTIFADMKRLKTVCSLGRRRVFGRILYRWHVLRGIEGGWISAKSDTLGRNSPQPRRTLKRVGFKTPAKPKRRFLDKGMINGSGVVTTRRSAYSSYATHPSKFMQVLHGNFMWGEIAPDPLLGCGDACSRILLWAMEPECYPRLTFTPAVIGYPEIETRDAAFKTTFEQWAEEFAWKGESTYAYDKMKGLAGYIYTRWS